ncbi:hypothetical protein M9H77_31202 [Catharanthus roseus]|uniref:Uncharacterized protein n=1 Tax=Catharanthus roseus TaxID=4058 RepID=A0ACC0A0F9_CATRO|nr:hypothetical protein M9H77_31202 [Catharanthus roseus]
MVRERRDSSLKDGLVTYDPEIKRMLQSTHRTLQFETTNNNGINPVDKMEEEYQDPPPVAYAEPTHKPRATGDDMSGDIEVPLILGHPFLVATKALIDVGEGKLALRLGDMKVVLRIPDVMRKSLDHDDTCFMIDVIDPYISAHVQEFLQDGALLIALQHDDQGKVDFEKMSSRSEDDERKQKQDESENDENGAGRISGERDCPLRVSSGSENDEKEQEWNENGAKTMKSE